MRLETFLFYLIVSVGIFGLFLAGAGGIAVAFLACFLFVEAHRFIRKKIDE